MSSFLFYTGEIKLKKAAYSLHSEIRASPPNKPTRKRARKEQLRARDERDFITSNAFTVGERPDPGCRRSDPAEEIRLSPKQLLEQREKIEEEREENEEKQEKEGLWAVAALAGDGGGRRRLGRRSCRRITGVGKTGTNRRRKRRKSKSRVGDLLAAAATVAGDDDSWSWRDLGWLGWWSRTPLLSLVSDAEGYTSRVLLPSVQMCS